MGFDPSAIRRHFPSATAQGAVAYLDSAATTQQPQDAIDAVRNAAMQGVGGVHRGLHPLSDASTTAFEAARTTAATFLGAAHDDEIIFTSGTTMGINMVAQGLGSRLRPGDAVALTVLDHHSNITPWMSVCQRQGAEIRWIGIDDMGQLNTDDIDAVFRDGCVRVLAVTGQSNVLGVRPDLASLIALARSKGALICVDAAQLAAHAPINVQELDCDFLACSGHKLYGPTGIGVLYGKRSLLATLPPLLTGGGMVRSVTREGYVPADPPTRFMAGTPNLLGAIGMAAALEWQMQWSWADRTAHERRMMAVLLEELRTVEGVRILGPADERISGCISFVVNGIHAHDIAEVLGANGVCVRAGHHCAQPLHDALGVDASVRASIGITTNEDDIRRLAPAICAAQELLR